MDSRRSRFAAVLAVLAATLAASARAADAIDARALAQIEALMQEKASRTPAQQKIDSNLLYRIKQSRDEPIAAGIASLETDVDVDPSDRALVDIVANVQDALLARLRELGAEIESVHRQYRAIRARLPLAAIETVASDPAVVFVQPAQEALIGGTGERDRGRGAGRQDPGASKDVSARLGRQLAAALPLAPRQADALNVSEGDVTHRAKLARQTYGVAGAGLKIGVLSNGVDPLAQVQLSGDLPSDVTVLPGQAGSASEGTAMLEIVHDLAPLAKLYFATAFGGIATFADNIRALRTAGCDIIVDDVGYFGESAFQKGQAPSLVTTTNGGLATQAVNDVTADGAMYFSSAGNEGNLDDGTSGTWEGDFLDGGPTAAPLPAGRLHDFNGSGATFDTLTSGSGNPISLSWSDPLGGSGNDYDLFVLNGTGTTVIASSTNLQTGSQDPLELISGAANVAGNRIVIVKHAAAATRGLHLSTNRSQIAIGTAGETHGHNCAVAGFGVAAVDAAGPFPGPFSSADHVETFSSNGFRRVFFDADSSPVTPGNVLFSSGGGQILVKPDITAADGVSCATPGFSTFFGTSAAAPHAAAIAALVKSAKPSLTPAQIRSALTSTAIDIEVAGTDRDSGVGILDAMAAVQSIAPPPKALLRLGTTTLAEDGGDGDGFVEPGECATLTVQLQNENATVAATAISAVLTTSTPGVTISSGSSNYANLAGGASGNNATAFQLSIANTVSCPLLADFTLTVTFAGGVSPQAYHFFVRVGLPAWQISTTLDATAPATVPGAVSATGLQTPRLTRDSVGASCNTPKSFPGTFSTGTRQFDSYTFTNCSGSPRCIVVSLAQTSGGANGLFAAAYSGSFDPNNLAANWLADPGVSGATTSFSFTVAGGASFVVVVNEVNSGGGIGDDYTLKVDGLCLPCAAYTGTCCATPDGTITAPASVCSGSAGNTASVPDAGAGATYAWTIGNGTITGGNGTRTIAFSAGSSGSVSLGVTVIKGEGCSASDTASPTISASGVCVSTGKAIEADPTDLATSDGNGVFEPGETVVAAPSWKNNSGSPASLTGAAATFTGPAGPVYSIADATSAYGTLAAGSTGSCLASGDCFRLGVTGARPATHWDTTFHETLSSTATKTWTLHLGDSFTDVPRSQPFYKKIETILHAGITAGCTTTTYCPAGLVSRSQMAIFLARGIAGGSAAVPAAGTVGANAYDCAAGGISLFSDVPATDIACKSVHYIAAQNVTLGCASGMYCPAGNVTRIEMASFIAKAVVAPGGGGAIPMTYGPDPTTGLSYSCNTGAPNVHFSDVPATDVFCKHVHFLWAKGIISGCTATQYCPTDNVTRDAMSKFLSNAFHLVLYGP